MQTDQTAGIQNLQTHEIEFAPRVFCDQPSGAAGASCGAGINLQLSHEDRLSGLQYGLRLDGELTKSLGRASISVERRQVIWANGSGLFSTMSGTQNGGINLTHSLELQF